MTRPAFVATAIICLAASRLAGQGTGAEPSPADQAEIRSLYQRLLTADAVRDTAEFSKLFAPGYTFVPPRGDTIITREQRIAAAAADTSAVQSQPRYGLRGCRTQVHGSTAVAHCRYTATFRLPDTATDSTREFISTAVLMKAGGRWQFIATHPALVRSR